MALFERHLFVILLWVSTGVSFYAHLSSAGTNRPFATGLIVVLALWLHLGCRVHRWTIDTVPTRNYLIAVAGLIVGFGLLAAIDAAYLFMLFGVFSFIFGFSTDTKQAAVVSAVITAIWVAAWLAHDLPSGALATPIFVWGIANAINVLSTRISAQNTERGELIERLNATREELAQTERERGMLAERSRLAREIHDTLAQGFTSVVLLTEAMHSQLDTLPRERIESSLSLLSSTARQNLDEARRLIAAEPPAALDNQSLSKALMGLADDLKRRTTASVEVIAPDDTSFGGSEEVVLFRVAQEACNNVAKHAEAERVTISLAVEDGSAELCISDDGIGRNSSAPTDDDDVLSGGSGLGIMADRVADIDGTLDVEFPNTGGTLVRATIPIAQIP